MSSIKKCAYCSSGGPFTKEHIWPRGIIERTQDYGARYLGKGSRFFGGDLTVKDVCQRCNNGALSTLDTYLCRLFDLYFHKVSQRRGWVSFRYDYDLLLRTLLKVSYNAARANDSDVELLLDTRDYVLARGKPEPRIELRLGIVLPSRNQGNSIPPMSYRAARVATTWALPPKASLRVVAINAYYFWVLLLPKGPTDPAFDETLEKIRSEMPRNRLSPGSTLVRVRTGPRDALEMHRDWMQNENAQSSFTKYQERSKK